jgi:RNA polymerase sigma factor (sigma-70 family)
MINLVTDPTNRREELFAKYQLMVMKLAHEFEKNFKFDDLAQEGFIGLLNAVEAKGEDLTPEYAWACIRNAMLGFMKGEVEFPSTGFDAMDYVLANPEDDDPQDPKRSYDDDIVDSADRTRFFENNLDGKEAEVLYLKYICGFSAPEIAGMCGLSSDTIQRLESSALFQLALVEEYPALTKELRRLILLTAIVHTTPTPKHLEGLCLAAGAGYDTMIQMSKDQARAVLTRLKKVGLGNGGAQ